MIEKAELYRELIERKSNYLESIQEIYKYAFDLLPKINRVFANYTGHGMEHSINVMQYMYELVTDISEISDLEITCMIYSALLHDIGMVVASEQEIDSIKKDELVYNARKYSVINEKYKNENIVLQECIRPAHGERAFEYIMAMDKSLFLIPEYTNCNFQEEIANICKAHTMNREWITQNLSRDQVKGKDALNAQYVAMLLRIGDSLDIDEKRAPIELYRLISPTGFGDNEWKQHYIIENREKIVRDRKTNVGRVTIYGQCDNSQIHRKFLNYLSGLSDELLWSTSYSGSRFEEKYRLLIQPHIDNRIQPKGFEISDLKIKIDYYAIMKLLMGESVYGNKKYGLRELVQNSIDACRVMMEEADKMEKYQYEPYVPKIQIIIDYKKEKMVVMDNGIGMSSEVLTKYFLNIGKSYYKSEEFLYQGKAYHPIGTFGIGFLACFMLSDSVVIETKHYIEKEGFTLELESDSEYVCKKNKVELIGDSGTAVILNLDSVFQAFDHKPENIKVFLENTFLNQLVQLQFVTVDAIRNTEELKLKKYEELNQDGIVLDSYLNGISASLGICSNDIKISKKFSELCQDQFAQNQEFYAYNPADKSLLKKDLEGDDLADYVNDGHMMVIKIQGVKETAKSEYEEWRKWNNGYNSPPSEMQTTIYFPIKYDEALLKYRKEGSHWCGNSGAEWLYIISSYQWEQLYHGNEHIESIIKESEMLATGLFGIELGIIPVINVGKYRYMEYQENHLFTNDEKENKTYWHGILLEKGGMEIDAEVIGITCGNCVVNILSNHVTPNVARNDLTYDEKMNIEYAIKRAMYQYIMNNMTDIDLKNAVQEFIDKRYPSDNAYYRKE